MLPREGIFKRTFLSDTRYLSRKYCTKFCYSMCVCVCVCSAVVENSTTFFGRLTRATIAVPTTGDECPTLLKNIGARLPVHGQPYPTSIFVAAFDNLPSSSPPHLRLLFKLLLQYTSLFYTELLLPVFSDRMTSHRHLKNSEIELPRWTRVFLLHPS